MFKKFVSFLIIFIATCLVFTCRTCFSADSYTLKTGISVVENIPKEFFGTWRVSSTLVSTDSESTFKQKSIDFWNLSRTGDVVTLSNPFSGASASIKVEEACYNLIKFNKSGDYDSKKLTDIVKLNLNKDTFSGENIIILETLSNIDKSVIKTERATYKINGEKISGNSITN